MLSVYVTSCVLFPFAHLLERFLCGGFFFFFLSPAQPKTANDEPRNTNTVSHRSLEVDWTSEPAQTSNPISLYCSGSAFVERGPKRNQMAFVWTVLYIRFQRILSQIK